MLIQQQKIICTVLNYYVYLLVAIKSVVTATRVTVEDHIIIKCS